MRLNCLHVIAGLNASAGGPSRSASSLCDALAESGVGVVLVAQRLAAESDADMVLPRNRSVIVESVPAYALFRGRLSPTLGHRLRELTADRGMVLIHSHGLWLQCNRVAAQVASRRAVPHIVSPRGMLEPWAFRYRFWKKFPFWHLWQRRVLQEAALLCATSAKEAEGFRRLGFRQPIAIIPNGVDMPRTVSPPRSVAPTTRTALFLSRIHPVKGLEDLVQAWSAVRPDGWHCLVAGPDEEGYEVRIREAVARAGLQECFTFAGPVSGDRKAELFRSADLFVLPTKSENFGVAIAEALAYEIPVITTWGAPWSCLREHRCGWWIDLGAEPLAAALREACALPVETLREMGRRGRCLVAEEFAWPRIGASMHAVYQWVSHGGEPPSCVRLDE